MSEIDDQPFPRGALLGASVMVGTALCLTTIVRLSGADISSMPPPQPVAVRYLQFVDRPDGGVTVYDARRAQTVEILPPGTNGFVRATMRNFARERRSNGVGADVPFELLASADGRLILEDPATGRKIDLEAFGQTNAGVFAGFLNVDSNVTVARSAGASP
jgi:putative photosynthetic complex assembly protein